MDFDDLLPDIGEFGLYQVLVSCLIGFLACHAGCQNIALNFLAPSVDHWCKVDRLQNFTFAQQRYIAVPYESTQTGGQRYSQCRRFDFDFSALTEGELFRWNRSQMALNTTVTCNAWVYDLSQFASSATDKFDLVCGRSLLKQLAGTLYLAGMFVGAVASGALSDRFGRKTAMMACVVEMLAFSVGAAFSPNYAAFVILRFFVCIGSIGAYTCGFVVYMEIIGPKWRMPLGVIYQIWFSLGFMLAAVYSYAVRDFTKVQLVMSVPYVIVLLTFHWLIPESPRWLLANSKENEAREVIKKIASVNNRPCPENLTLSSSKPQDNQNDNEKRPSLVDLFKAPNLRKTTLILYLVWFTCTLMYYGLSLNISSLSGSIHLNTFISGVVEVPANIICVFLLMKAGRKFAIAGALIFASLTMFGTIPLLYKKNLSNVRTALNMLGKAGVTVAFSGVYVWSAELFPTVLRNVGVGSSSTVARISGMAAPYIGGPLRKIWLPMPSVIFGAFSGITGLVALILPETLNKTLPETIEECEQFGKKTSESRNALTSYSLEAVPATINDTHL